MDGQSVPVFGDAAPGVVAIIRPSAYGVISDGSERIAVVRNPLGLYLPGGGSEASETPEETVVRETREECGLTVRVRSWRRAAIEHVYSATEDTYFEKHDTFCDALATGPAGAPIDPDHALEWMVAVDATARLTPASHRWAVGEWLTFHLHHLT